MPRPLRIEYPGACYHVICRGNARLPIFRADTDKELFLDRMVHFAEIYRVEIRAYCVMVNHVHIHLRTLDANLGAFMRSFLTSFTACTTTATTPAVMCFRDDIRHLFLKMPNHTLAK